MANYAQLKNGTLATVFLLSFNAFAQDDAQSNGATSERPNIYVSPSPGNPQGPTVYSPGDNQPVRESQEGNRIKLDYDTRPAPDSEIRVVPDPVNR